MRFEKVSFDAFKNDVMTYRPMNYMEGHIEEAYDNIVIPVRKTKYSAGYDICTPIDIALPSGQRRIESVADFDECESLWYKWNEKTVHRSVLISLQYRTLMNSIISGRIFVAERRTDDANANA